jgi:Ca-activated chloride channel family protein
MTFAYPGVLVLLVIPLLLLAWVWRRSSVGFAMPFDYGRGGRAPVLQTLVNLAGCTPPLLLAVVVVLLSGPQQLSEPKSRRVLTNIEFCVDISGSMTARFGDGTRYDASMKSIDAFLDFRKGDAFGLTFFGNNVLHWTPLTTDPSAIRCAPPFMRPENAPPWFGGTMIAKALSACREVLIEREEGDRMIILITDGYSFDLSSGVDEEIGRKLKDDRITVYTVHVAEGAVPPEVATIANITGGEAFKADDPDGLRTVFGRIDQMQQTRMEKTSAETMDDFEPWCIAGMVLLSLALLAAFGLRYTPW